MNGLFDGTLLARIWGGLNKTFVDQGRDTVIDRGFLTEMASRGEPIGPEEKAHLALIAKRDHVPDYEVHDAVRAYYTFQAEKFLETTIGGVNATKANYEVHKPEVGKRVSAAENEKNNQALKLVAGLRSGEKDPVHNGDLITHLRNTGGIVSREEVESAVREAFRLQGEELIAELYD